jgi:hypothetical protein
MKIQAIVSLIAMDSLWLSTLALFWAHASQEAKR